MFTVLLALIDAQYNIDFKYLYLGTICIDMSMWDSIGKLFKKPIKEKKECQHEWETIKEAELKNGNGSHLEYQYILKCKKCGDIIKKSF